MIRNSKLVKKLSLLLSSVLIFSVVGCTSNSKETVQKTNVQGYMWEATKDDKTVTLIGTMHPAPSTHNLLNEGMINAIEGSDVLSVECDLSIEGNLMKVQNSSFLPEGETIDKYLSQEEIDKYMEVVNSFGKPIDTNTMKKFNSNGLNSLISSLIFMEMGFDGQVSDVEAVKIAKKKSIEVNELEGVDFQTEMLNNMFDWDSLKASVEAFSEETKKQSIEDIKSIFESYVTGETEKAEALEVTMKNADPENYKIIQTDRNVVMANNIDKLVNDGRKHTIAVGYRHYFGEDSVLKQLESKGYTIKRVNI